jgi:hypothetical protein
MYFHEKNSLKHSDETLAQLQEEALNDADQREDLFWNEIAFMEEKQESER